jgi:hypothetical protein
MARERATAMESAGEARAARPVRFDPAPGDRERPERCARRYGPSESPYVRMALFERMESDEGEGRRRPPP